jgi:hypothetical protein
VVNAQISWSQNKAHARLLQQGGRTWVIAVLFHAIFFAGIIPYPSGDGEARGRAPRMAGMPRTRPVFFRVEVFDVSGNRFD